VANPKVRGGGFHGSWSSSAAGAFVGSSSSSKVLARAAVRRNRIAMIGMGEREPDNVDAPITLRDGGLRVVSGSGR